MFSQNSIELPGPAIFSRHIPKQDGQMNNLGTGKRYQFDFKSKETKREMYFPLYSKAMEKPRKLTKSHRKGMCI